MRAFTVIGSSPTLTVNGGSCITSFALRRRNPFNTRSAPMKFLTNSFLGELSSVAGSAYCTSSPSRIRAMVSPILIASLMSCVTKAIVFLILPWILRNSSCSLLRVIGSIAPNGSSINRMGGSAPRQRATPIRCCCPPESSLGYRSMNVFGSIPTKFSSSSARLRFFCFGHFNSVGTVAMFSATVRCGKSPMF